MSCNFMSCIFRLCTFMPYIFGPSFSCPAISCPAYWSFIFTSCNFMPCKYRENWSDNFMSCNFMPCTLVRLFHVLQFHELQFWWSVIFMSCIFSQPLCCRILQKVWNEKLNSINFRKVVIKVYKHAPPTMHSPQGVPGGMEGWAHLSMGTFTYQHAVTHPRNNRPTAE